MKLHEIIKRQRLANNMTQEQIATYVGVSTPAVNKWEKAVSYPDITLLPALARVLGVDLNTLLSFQEDLSEHEIALFLNQLSQVIQKQGFHEGYDMGMKKIKEYPTCYGLLLHVAMQLDGAVLLDKKMKKQKDQIQAELEGLYERVLASEDVSLKSLAQSKLIQRYMERKEYENATALLAQLPNALVVDKKHIQAKICMANEAYAEAARLEEERLLASVQAIQETLLSLMEIACKDKRMEDGEYIANVAKESAKLFDLWEFLERLPQFQLYLETKNHIKCLKALVPLLTSLKKKWDVNASALYRHVKTTPKEIQDTEDISKLFTDVLLADEQTSFLKDDEEFQRIVHTYQHKA